MKPTLHIVPGYGHTAKMMEYQSIKKCAHLKKYDVSIASIDWAVPISKQILTLKKNDVVFGFSLGAIIARISYKKNPCKKILLGSETPLYKTTRSDILRATNGDTAFADDLLRIKKKLPTLKIISSNCIYLSGDHEKLRGRKVKNTGHELTREYIHRICEYL